MCVGLCVGMCVYVYECVFKPKASIGNACEMQCRKNFERVMRTQVDADYEYIPIYERSTFY